MIRRKCTKNNPFTSKRNSPKSNWEHIDAKEMDYTQESHQYGGDTVRYKCPYCDIEFTTELPQ